ncbi:hypothetical protein BG842_10615 [Haladaptatus sp. W1]|uniref:hypothetical protein n=1 Tax=Haladaptatus sp. W1 TaxID=1897478 RepID=UPI000849D75A|nr:hypothetical protein [Haladaptatus sp. W1]ODR80750.1 hypothetical protein BG842_10615 [Haladaptatus sp. W1]
MDLRGECQNGTRTSGATPSSTEPSARGTLISWELGEHLSNCNDVPRVTERTESGRTKTIYDLTEETYLVQTRTPVGRERYREVPKRDLDA